MKKNILFVDDNVQLANMMSEFFSYSGFSIETATDSRKALQRFRGDPNKFDIVITDQTMPGISGYELAREILAQRPGLPIFLCTGYSDDIDEQQAIDAGIRRFFIKPVGLDHLLKCVNEECGAISPLDADYISS